MKRLLALAATLAFPLTSLWSAPPVVKTVPWVSANPLVPHNTWSGKSIRLKGTADVQGATISYTWDFGDGSPIATGTVTNRYAIEAAHTYTGATGTIYTARLTVRNTTTGEATTREYYLQIYNKTLAVEVNVAIDEGLWHLHKTQTRTNTGGVDFGSWGSWNSNTAANVHAFEVGGHLDTGDATDPYTETVQRGMRRIFNQLAPISIGLESGGRNPDSNGNGIAITVAGGRGYECYEVGIIADAILASGRPGALAETGPANVVGRTYKDIVQDMVDFYAHGQWDSGNATFPILGGWGYSAQHSHVDNSISQWGAITIIPAVRNWGCVVPAWLYTANADWLRFSQATTGTNRGVFGYTGSGVNGTTGPYATTPSGMIQLCMLGRGRGDEQWDRAETFLRDHFSDPAAENAWRSNIKQYHYGMFAFVKAMLTHDSNGDGIPEPIVLLQSTTPGVPPIDWYAAQVSQGDPTDGFARTLVDDQQVAGNWTDHSWTNETDSFGTAWAIIMLRGTLFESGGPVAVARANPNPAIAGQTIRLDGAASFHQDSAKSIVGWQWDLNNDGAFDATGPFSSVSFPTVGSYLVRLRVTDNSTVPLTADDVLTIVVSTPPLAPTADAGGPYIFCPTVPSWFLDGSRSTNPDEGLSQPGRPADTIIEYAWELNGDNSFDDAFGPSPNVTAYFTGRGPGTYVVQLRVTDNTASSYPLSGQPNLTSVASAVVVVRADCACIENLAARPKQSKVQLTWTNFGSHHYNVYRATTSGGPYAQIDFTDSTYSTYLDDDVQLGRTYYYVVRPADGLNRELCQSNEASATPTQRPTSPGNFAPVANAGPAQTAGVGQLVTLDGTASSDANGDPLTYRWTFTSRPSGSAATLSAANVARPTFTLDAAGSYIVSLVVNDGAVDSAPSSVTISSFNSPPVANAGPAQSVEVGLTVTLDGSASRDVDGDPLTFQWDFQNKPAGSNATITPANGVRPTFTVDAAGTYTARLVVNDGVANSPAATVLITTRNSAPVASAGPDQTASLFEIVMLDGSASTDVDGDPMTYAWSFQSRPSGSGATLSSMTAVKPTFTVDRHGTYVLQLIVNDGVLVSGPDTVTISTQNSRPIANAGPDQSMRVGNLTTLDGSASSDVDGNALTFRWSLTRPAGSTATLSSTTAVMPTFVVDRPGSYIAQLIVNDGTVDSLADTVSVSTLNAPPVADAGRHQTVVTPRTFTLDGSGSSDADGDRLAYFWSLVTAPAGSAATVSDSSAVKPTVRLDLAGTYVAQLIVDDGTADSAPATVSLTTLNTAPVADSGLDFTAGATQTVALDGSASSDFNGDRLSFLWSLITKPMGSTAAFSDATAVKPALTLDRAGDYVAQLIVNDGSANSQPDTVRISTINSRPVARAGAAQTVAVGATAHLDGRGSFDPDSDPITYRWAIVSRPPGSTATLSLPPPPVAAVVPTASATKPSVKPRPSKVRPAPTPKRVTKGATAKSVPSAPRPSAPTPPPPPPTNLPAPTFVADRAGDYVIQLIVSDGRNDSAPNTVVISTRNSKPVAHAGPAQAVLIGASVQLTGAASIDSDGNALAYRWALTTRPAGSAAALSNAAIVNPAVVADRAGVYVAQLIVDDGAESSEPATVTILATPPLVAVPEVVGFSEAAAEGSILAAGLTVGTKTTAHSIAVPMGHVISQSPLGGATAPQGSPVNLVISLGATSVTVPNVVGLSQTAASSAIVAAGLTVGAVTQVPSTTIPQGEVFSQSPGAGAIVPGPSPVNLTVSAGVGSAIVPNLVGLTPAQAGAALFQARLVLGAVGAAPDASIPAGQIHTQLPPAGASAIPGAAVDVAISTGALMPDATPPAVTIHNPATDAAITYLTDIVATVADTNLALYLLQIAPAGTVDASNPALDDPDYTTIAQGTAPVANGVVGRIDPTTLLNDTYIVRLKAIDAGGLITAQSIAVGVGGGAKLGRFSLEFVDLAVPLAGIPIQVIRRYDTQQAGVSGDFGYGWSLGLRDASIRALLKPSFAGPTLAPASRLFITAPDGRRLGFTAQHRVISIFLGILVEVSFRPDPGISEKLDILDGNQCYLSSGLYMGGLLGSDIYVPQKYRLTLHSGAQYDYDRLAGLERIADPSGNTITFTANAITHSGGVAIPLVRDGQGRITQITDPAGASILYSYSASGDLATVTDREGAVTRFNYKAVPRHFLDAIIDPLGRLAVRTEYDENGRVTAVIDALGNRREQAFDPGSFSGTRTDARGNVTTFLFDARGNILQETTAEGGARSYEYSDPVNPTKPTRVVDAEGNSFTLTYDAEGRMLTTSVPGGGPLSFTYSGDHVSQFTSSAGAVTTAAYDAAGRITHLSPPGAPALQIAYNANGQPSSVRKGANNPVLFDYAPSGKPSKVTWEDGHFQSFTYDNAGRVRTRTNELGKITEFRHDRAGRLLGKKDSAGNEETFAYNAAGKMVRHRMRDGMEETFRYDEAGRMTGRTVGDEQTTVSHDADGRLSHVRDPAGNEVLLSYDRDGDLKERRDPLGKLTEFQHDGNGSRKQIIDRLGRKRLFTRDYLGRLTKEEWFAPAGALVRTINYTYDADGKLVSASDPDATLTLTPDAIGRFTRTETSYPGFSAFVLNFTRDANGRLTQVTDSRGATAASTYDARGALLTRTVSLGAESWRVERTLNAKGQPMEVRRYAGISVTPSVTTQFSYADPGWVQSIQHFGSGGSALGSFTYSRNVSGVTTSVSGTNAATYTHDMLGRLTGVDRFSGTDEAFTYSANGNRATYQSGGSFTSVTGPANRLLDDGRFTYSYDDEGNVLEKRDKASGSAVLLMWDHRNRLVEERLAAPGGAILRTVQYRYDILNRRTATIVDGALQFVTVYAGDHPWADLAPDGTVLARYIIGAAVDDLWAIWRPGSGLTWTLGDKQRNLVLTTNAAGALVGSRTYAAFGGILAQTGAASFGRFGFQGREHDPDTGFIYLRARYLDPDCGRYLSEDPLDFKAGSTNLYAFAGNRPTDMSDPSGLMVALEYAVLAVEFTGGGVEVEGEISVPSSGEVLGALIGFFHGFGFANLVFLGEVIGNPSGDLAEAVCRTKKYSEDFLERVSPSADLDSTGFVGGFWEGAGINISLEVEFFDVIECEFTTVLFQKGGFSGGLDFAITRLEFMFGADCKDDPEPPFEFGGCELD